MSVPVTFVKKSPQAIGSLRRHGGATQAKNKNVLFRGWIRHDTVVRS